MMISVLALNYVSVILRIKAEQARKSHFTDFSAFIIIVILHVHTACSITEKHNNIDCFLLTSDEHPFHSLGHSFD